jgi:hypothetical protein
MTSDATAVEGQSPVVTGGTTMRHTRLYDTDNEHGSPRNGRMITPCTI